MICPRLDMALAQTPAFLITLALATVRPCGDVAEARKGPSTPSVVAESTPVEVAPCQPDSPEAQRASAAFDVLGGRVFTLGVTSDPAPVMDELLALLATPCFQRAREHGPFPTFDNALGLKEWWQAGADVWLGAYLKPRTGGLINDPKEQVVFPPRPRAVLSLDTTPTHRLARLLCPLEGDICGKETEGWVERAEEAFAAHQLKHRVYDREGFPVRSEVLAERCFDVAMEDELQPKYADWLWCLSRNRTVDWALPLGRFRSPRTGWLVVRGRRGHSVACDEVRAYDLATGAAYVAQAPPGLCRPDGRVVLGATDPERELAVSEGRVDLSNLREASWMILIEAETGETYLHADFFALPAGLKPTAVRAPRRFAATPFLHWTSGWSHSGQTRLSWTWLGSTGEVLDSGRLTWRNSYSAAESHAADLISIAERSFTEGCAPAALPPLDAAMSEPKGDPSHVETVTMQRRLAIALRDHASSRTCAESSASR